MSKLRFTAEDFKRCTTKERSDLRQFIADEANKRLAEMLREDGLEVFSALPECRWFTGPYRRGDDVFHGVLVNVERIDGK